MPDVDRLLTEAGERWRASQPPAPLFAPPSARAESQRWAPRLAAWTTAAAAVLIVAAGLSFGLLSRGPSGPSASGTSLSPTGEATPVPSQALDMVDGLPVSIDGQPVLRGDAALAAFSRSTDAAPILVGGWLRPPFAVPCPVYRGTPDDRWNPCSGIWLFESAVTDPTVATPAIILHLGLVPASLETVPDGLVRPIVVRVHTHDVTCKAADCRLLAVVEAVAWLGPVGPPAPVVPDSCSVTKPDPAYVPPDSFPGTGIPGTSWYGSDRLWTSLDVGGEVWSGAPMTATGIPVKLFWWSVDWSMREEPEPPILVAGRRLDGPGSFSYGPGTNASEGSIGTAMLVGIDVPSTGCWEITGYYRQATLSFVVWVSSGSGATTAPGLTAAAVDAMTARTIATQFEQARTIPTWDVAWAYISAFSQRQLGSEAAFAAAEAAYNEAGGLRYEVGDALSWPFESIDPAYFAPGLLADIEATADTSRAFLVTIVHPEVEGASAGTRAYVVAPISATEWRIWVVH
jgi:hypothetical protein